MLAVAVAVVTGCMPTATVVGPSATPTPPQAATDHHVARPGLVLISPAQRRAQLAAMPVSVRVRYCAVPEDAPTNPSRLQPVRRLRALPDGPDPASEPFALAVMLNAAAAFGTGDEAAHHGVVALLDQWAEADALTRLERRTANTYYALDRTLLPIIVAFALLRDDPMVRVEQRTRIETWLARVERLRGDGRGPPDPRNLSGRNNHAYLRASVSMAWGALTGNDRSFRSGVAAYRQALGEMRPDGSLPLETRRGTRALWYQRHAVASLVAMAEMAAVQGYDLYGYEADGKSLHTAIRFLLDATHDPQLVRTYAREGTEPRADAKPQDLSFLTRRGHGRHYMAWAEIYMARFPNREESRRLAKLLHDTAPDFRPMVDDYSGGNTTCFFAQPDPPA